MRLGKIDVIVVGADHVSTNGNVDSKIGTYGLAVLAKEHRVSFYAAVPTKYHRRGSEQRRGHPY